MNVFQIIAWLVLLQPFNVSPQRCMRVYYTIAAMLCVLKLFVSRENNCARTAGAKVQVHNIINIIY